MCHRAEGVSGKKTFEKWNEQTSFFEDGFPPKYHLDILCPNSLLMTGLDLEKTG